VIVPEFEGHLGNDTLIIVISFLERVRIHKEQNQGWGTKAMFLATTIFL
jgi:hypothetical protein